MQAAAIPSNDYSALEARYRTVTGHELVSDPHASLRHQPPLTLSASVVIPAWKAASTLERCLEAISLSSFNRRYPDRLEVVVVDDGSTDGTWDALRQLAPGVTMKAIRKEHGQSKAQTQNTGFAFAEGDVVISCDADMVLAPFAIEELVKRHEYAGHALLLGLYSYVAPDDPRVAVSGFGEASSLCPPLLTGDPRLAIGSVWPESAFRDTRHFKRLGGDRQLIDGEGRAWTAWYAVYGALLSLLKTDWRTIGGFDERFVGWGSEDAMLGVRAESLGLPIIPVYSAHGWHIAHPPRNDTKSEDSRRNWSLLQRLRREPFSPSNGETIDRAADRVVARFECNQGGGPRRTITDEDTLAAYDAHLADPMARADYLHALGRYDEAVIAFGDVAGSDERVPAAVVKRARSLRLSGRAGSAVALLQTALFALPAAAGALGELALALAAAGELSEARHWIDRAHRQAASDAAVEYILSHDAAHHRSRADHYARQGDDDLAVRDYEAALIVDPHDAVTRAARNRSRHAAGRRARRRASSPLPVISRIVAAAETIPGWIAPDEIETLVALTWSIAACRNLDGPPVFVVVGSEYGRAPVAIGLALRSLDRDDARIVAIDVPDVALNLSESPPRQVLREQVEAFDLTEMIVLSPEEDGEPWTRRSQLVLLDGKHDEESVRADVAHYAPGLVAGGYLLIHDDTTHFPGVQTVVAELLADPAYRLVIRAGSLVALTTVDNAR